jgi:sulfatase maturation enzyme AslB (radical SAM superfamily)
MNPIIVPKTYDYIGVYLTNKCHLDCFYCITKHNNSGFKEHKIKELTPKQWIEGLNRLQIESDIPVTLQGGEPFMYKGVWKILDECRHKIDIMTALPPLVTREKFLELQDLDWNKRKAPYPTIRVSYHPRQNDWKDLINRIAELQDILSIGLYYLDPPINSHEQIEEFWAYAREHGNIFIRAKEYLGYEGKGKNRFKGYYLYKDAVMGKRFGVTTYCKNTVIPIAPDGNIYKCHSDLYFNRQGLKLGNIMDKDFDLPRKHMKCTNYGLCSACDTKIKTNHHEKGGYTSVHIQGEPDPE